MKPADREAFDAFARDRGPALLRYGLVLAADRAAAGDLVQEALARTAAAWPRLRQADPEGYVRRTMLNLSVSWWRRRRREVLVQGADVPETAYHDPAPRDAVLWQALRAVPPRQRAVLVLRFLEDLSEVETARLLGCSVGTVKSQTSKALARLRLDLAEEVALWP